MRSETISNYKQQKMLDPTMLNGNFVFFLLLLFMWQPLHLHNPLVDNGEGEESNE